MIAIRFCMYTLINAQVCHEIDCTASESLHKRYGVPSLSAVTHHVHKEKQTKSFLL